MEKLSWFFSLKAQLGVFFKSLFDFFQLCTKDFLTLKSKYNEIFFNIQNLIMKIKIIQM